MGVLNNIRRLFWKETASATAASERIQKAVAELRRVAASYDAARNSDEYKNYWANADALDADSANSRDVRLALIKRSRYECTNNGYADGIAQTYSTDLIGISPTLRMQTGSNGFNQMVEREFFLWSQATRFSRKLWTMAHAKHVDGESFAVMRRNPRVRHRIPLDLVLYEAEQCSTPFLPFNAPGYIDGIKFDKFGNPEWYDFLTRHPGATNSYAPNFLEPERIPADRVLHWFKLRRPGQHRGIPESASTLNLGAAFRRLREASLSTAEKVATWTLFLKTMFQPEPGEIDPVIPMQLLNIDRGMMTALPNSVEPFQLRAEQPGATYDSFHKTLLNEQARPKNMPYNKAACDSSQYNYASGRLDHQTYYGALDVDRKDCADLVLDPLFEVWFDLAIARFGWLGGDPSVVTAGARFHLWDWPKHKVADVESEANANQTKLQSGQIGLHQLYTEAGMDLEDEIPKMAETFGVDEAEIRTRLLDVILPPAQKSEPAPSSEESTGLALAAEFIHAGWITLDSGVHVYVGEDGTIEKGPNSMVGKTVKEVSDESKSGRWPSPKQPSGKKQRVKIDKAAKELGRQGWSLGPANPWAPGQKETTYRVTHKKTGRIEYRTAREIHEVVVNMGFEWESMQLADRLNGHAHAYANS